MYLQSQHFTGNATRVPEAQTLLHASLSPLMFPSQPTKSKPAIV